MGRRNKPKSKGFPSPTGTIVPPSSDRVPDLPTVVEPQPTALVAAPISNSDQLAVAPAQCAPSVETVTQIICPYDWAPPDEWTHCDEEKLRADYWQIRADHKEERHRRRDDYYKDRSILLDALMEGSKLHDTTIISVTSGAIALSFAFIEKVAVQPDPTTLPFVGIAWGCFVVSLACVLGSFLSSQRACERAIDILDQGYQSQGVPNPNIDTSNIYAERTRNLNRYTYIALCLGVVFLGVFAYVNLEEKFAQEKGNKMPDKSPQQGPVQVPASNTAPTQLPSGIHTGPKPNSGVVVPQPVSPAIKINPPPTKKN